MAQLAQGFGFDLPDAFTGNTKVLTNFLKCSGTSVVKPKAETQDFFFPRRQSLQYLFKLLFQQHKGGRFRRRRSVQRLTTTR